MLLLALAAACGEDPGVAVPQDGGVPDAGQAGDAVPLGDGEAAPPDAGQAEADALAADGADSEGPVPLCPADECEIDGVCHANEAPNPDNPCELCLVAVDSAGWTPDDTLSCDDGNACTATDRCLDGSCTGTDPTVCDDGNPCTDDGCDAETGACVAVPNDAPCDDGDVCTLHSTCAMGGCQKGTTPVSCDDGKPCTADACDPAAGCSSAPIADGGPCDDGDACTVDEVCAAGACAGLPRNCDDGDVCSVDACVQAQGCIHVGLEALCDDGNPCTEESCQPEKGCVYTFTTASCDDGNACTGPDLCSGGACLGIAIDPSDANPCTIDTCIPSIGPVHTPNKQACDDGSLCTLGDQCKDGLCAPGPTALPCDDGNVCTTDGCDPTSGCVHEPNALPCDDGSACTEIDTCVAGVCAGTGPLHCDDGNDCTIDSCEPDAGCKTTLVSVSACRPEIIVTYPPRGATILGSAASQVVVVTGTVESGAGPVVSLTVNGKDAKLSDGAFSLAVTPQVGGNILVLVATDSFGSVRKRVQSFLWSTAYHKPVLEVPKSGMADPGLGIWLAQGVMSKLADSLVPLLGALQLGDSIPSPVYSGNGYKVYVKNLTHNPPKLTLAPKDGGLQLTVTITGIKADLDAPGKCEECVLGICVDLCPDFDGDLTVSSVHAKADVLLSVVDHALVASVANVDVTVSGADVDIDGVLGWIIDPVLDMVVDDLVEDMEKSIEGSVSDELEPALEEALGGLAIASTFDMPSLDPAGGSVPVLLLTDFSSVHFDATGGLVLLRAGAYAPRLTPFDNLGALARMGCNLGPQTMTLPKKNPFELALADDTMNELLYAAWNGGLLQFDVPAQMLADVDLSEYGITSMTISVSGMLAPTLSDCGETGELDVHIGDLGVTASITLLGTEMTVVMYVSLIAGFQLTVPAEGPGSQALGLGLTKIKSLQSEVTVLQDELIGSEKMVAELVNKNLVPALMGSLGEGAFGSIPLPEMELSGGAVIGMKPKSVDRVGGNTVIGGDLK